MKRRSLLFSLGVVVALASFAKPSPRWVDQKFSMFIHFGLYSVYGGVYEGEPVTRGYSEQIQSFAGIFSDWYANTASDFNPVHWNPDSIVSLAKEAGMRSIVITSKHHDGFCMYHSRYTDFNIVDATPYRRDLMKELAEACESRGIDFGVYFSLIDWNYPHGYPISSHNADPLTPQHYAFNLKQVEEIMTHYGDISEIWFDMGSLTPEQSRGLYELVNRLQPDCMISGRLGNDYVDFAVMADNEYPEYKMGMPWQTAASMFDETWGYRSWQERGEVQPKVEEKIASLVKVVSRGGNYLLNIGPRGDGSVVPFESEVLRGIGEWLKVNGEAIYGAKANPFHHSFEWGDVTCNEGSLYLFIRNLPTSGKIELRGIDGIVTAASLLSSGKLLPCRLRNRVLSIDLSGLASDEVLPVLKVSFRNGYSVLPDPIVKREALTPRNAMPLFGHSSLNYYAGYKSLIGYDWAWQQRPGRYVPEICFTDQEVGRHVKVEIAGTRHEVTLEPIMTTQVTLSPGSVRWGSLYRKPGRGVFGNVEEEGVGEVDPKRPGSRWVAVTDFRYGESYSEPILPRESVLFLQEIESLLEQTIAVKLTSGNAAYVLLNGEYITAHFSPQRVEKQEELLLLPLRKGKNQLVVKLYNGFGNVLHYGIEPLEEWAIHTVKLEPVRLGREEFHHVSLRAAGAEASASSVASPVVTAIPDVPSVSTSVFPAAYSAVSPLRMSNVSISFSVPR